MKSPGSANNCVLGIFIALVPALCYRQFSQSSRDQPAGYAGIILSIIGTEHITSKMDRMLGPYYRSLLDQEKIDIL